MYVLLCAIFPHKVFHILTLHRHPSTHAGNSYIVEPGLIFPQCSVCTYIYTCKVITNSLNDGNTINQHQCQVIMKDPQKTQDLAGIQTQDLLITGQSLLPLHEPLDLLWQRSDLH